jgi:hypothetical protein
MQYELGQEIGRGNSGSVHEVLGHPTLVAKISTNREPKKLQDLEQECAAMGALSDLGMSPNCHSIEHEDEETDLVIIMDKLDGPTLTCSDFEQTNVQKRLFEISIEASKHGINVADAHPGNYMWHRGQVLRVDAQKVASVPTYGFTKGFVPRSIFAHNMYFIDCENTPLLHKMQRAFEFEFGVRSHLSGDPDMKALAEVRTIMAPSPETARRVRRPRVAATKENLENKELDPAFVKLVPVAGTLEEHGGWTHARLNQLEDAIIGLSLGRFYVRSADFTNLQQAFSVGKKGELVCNAPEKADPMTPTFNIWLTNTILRETDLKEFSNLTLRRNLILFAFSLRLAFSDESKPKAETLIVSGGSSSTRQLGADLDLFQRWITRGEIPPRKLKHFDQALKELGIKRKQVGQAFEFYMQYLL